VLAALRYELRRGNDVAVPWTQFLYSTARRSDKPKIAALIVRRLAALPQPALGAIITPATYWLENARKQLYECDREALWTVFDRLVDALATNPASAEPRTLAPGETRDWAGSSAAGSLAETLLGDPKLAELLPGDALPDKWLTKAERLISLPGNHGRFILARLSRQLGWLHTRAAAWSERHIIAAILGDGASRDAALAGFFTTARVGDKQLYTLLRPLLIDLSIDKKQSQRRHTHAIVAFFVSGWRTTDDDGTRWLSDDEFRRILINGGDDLRTDVLWHAGRLEFAEKITFLRKVWPLQLSVRTPVVVSRLCTLAFDDEKHFPELVSAILPLLSHAQIGSVAWLPHDKIETIANYPDQVLDLLAVMLPDDVARWPYGVGQMLERVIKAKPALGTDPRIIRLKGIWDRR
jgi:hypothetical protein